jgi:hypothetical protein
MARAPLSATQRPCGVAAIPSAHLPTGKTFGVRVFAAGGALSATASDPPLASSARETSSLAKNLQTIPKPF